MFRTPSGLFIPNESRAIDPDKFVMGRLRDVMNAEARKLGASEISMVATLSLLTAQLCNKHCGDDIGKQDKWLDVFMGAVKTSLSVHTARQPENDAQRAVVEKYIGG